MELEYGKITTKSFDRDGNYNEVEENIVAGQVNLPVSRTVEERVKVCSQAEEFAEYKKFSDWVHTNPDIVRPSFKLDESSIGKRNGYYFVIKCYTG